MRFEVLLGPEDGELKEKGGDKITLGRGAKNVVAFPYARMVSGKHAEGYKEGDTYYIMDVGSDCNGSKNGTRILKRDGEEIEIWKENENPPFPGEKVPIEPGDIIILGRSIWLKFLGD